MKLIEGNISTVPSKPDTGLVGMLAKHRKALDPNFNPQASLKDLHALARAIIEALGGKLGENGWEVDLALVDVDVDLNLGANKKRVEELAARLEKLEQTLAAFGKVEPIEATVGEFDFSTNPVILELGARLANLERQVAPVAPVARKKGG